MLGHEAISQQVSCRPGACGAERLISSDLDTPHQQVNEAILQGFHSVNLVLVEQSLSLLLTWEHHTMQVYEAILQSFYPVNVVLMEQICLSF